MKRQKPLDKKFWKEDVHGKWGRWAKKMERTFIKKFIDKEVEEEFKEKE